ncbi:MAG: NYN domain-containing protein [Desulfobulbaceae bacterium]|nr:NYN domain-containing protein [Desulfobulbaceae bacterium]
MKTAILIDGGFFLKRYPKVFRNGYNHGPKTIADNMYKMCIRHLSRQHASASPQLYRILFYDCEPFKGTSHNPISHRHIAFATTKTAIEREQFFEELKKRRKVALRLGKVHSDNYWIIKPYRTKQLLNGTMQASGLLPDDVYYSLRQKGVDIKIGLDIAALSYKEKVDQIILISGDSDFVPAAKTARREGIDFILDPMWNPISDDLHEHIDGLASTCENPTKPFVGTTYPYIINTEVT